MEKYGVIKAGVTPPEQNEKPAQTDEKQAKVADLDNDFRKRAAEVVQHANK